MMKAPHKINIAIDGYSSCGKSTIAKGLAQAAGYTYIDSGAMYRAVGLYCLRNELLGENGVNEHVLRASIDDLAIEFKHDRNGSAATYMNGENVECEIRTLEAANAASQVSTLRFVREAMVRLQQLMGKQKGVVMDGRDIGTVVFPDAELKVFLTASPEIRAERRYKELATKGEKITLEEVLANIKERDDRDTQRAESPLKRADDALLLDNSHLTVQQQLDWILKEFNRITGQNTKNV
jgi:cytidylate kinase